MDNSNEIIKKKLELKIVETKNSLEQMKLRKKEVQKDLIDINNNINKINNELSDLELKLMLLDVRRL